MIHCEEALSDQQCNITFSEMTRETTSTLLGETMHREGYAGGKDYVSVLLGGHGVRNRQWSTPFRPLSQV